MSVSKIDNIDARLYGVAGVLCFFISILMGAVIAHVLKAQLTPTELDWLDTANRYLSYSGIGLLVCWQCRVSLWQKQAAWLLGLGAISFSGNLYLLALVQWRVAFLVPAGGVLMLLGWVVLARAVWVAPTLPR